MSDDTAEGANTNRELWRERPDDYYADSLFVTEGGGIGINIGGSVKVRPIRVWFAAMDDDEFARAGDLAACRARCAELEKLLTECADKLERCAVSGGTTHEYAAIAVAKFRAVLAKT